MLTFIKTTFTVLLIFSTYCSSFAQTQDSTLMKKVQFSNIDSEENRIEVLDIIDRSLIQNGNFGVYGDLSDGVAEILKENYMSVTNGKKILNISVAPDSQAGHDFSFSINKQSLEISDLIVGEVIPPPDM
ncbi:MAG: hypothetical protein KOO66_05270 [Bacteroidales bacterium]|nr:hypothetical protein [Bacteroidales bacterium]